MYDRNNPILQQFKRQLTCRIHLFKLNVILLLEDLAEDYANLRGLAAFYTPIVIHLYQLFTI